MERILRDDDIYHKYLKDGFYHAVIVHGYKTKVRVYLSCGGKNMSSYQFDSLYQAVDYIKNELFLTTKQYLVLQRK